MPNTNSHFLSRLQLFPEVHAFTNLRDCLLTLSASLGIIIMLIGFYAASDAIAKSTSSYKLFGGECQYHITASDAGDRCPVSL